MGNEGTIGLMVYDIDHARCRMGPHPEALHQNARVRRCLRLLQLVLHLNIGAARTGERNDLRDLVKPRAQTPPSTHRLDGRLPPCQRGAEQTERLARARGTLQKRILALPRRRGHAFRDFEAARVMLCNAQWPLYAQLAEPPGL